MPNLVGDILSFHLEMLSILVFFFPRSRFVWFISVLVCMVCVFLATHCVLARVYVCATHDTFSLHFDTIFSQSLSGVISSLSFILHSLRTDLSQLDVFWYAFTWFFFQLLSVQ